MSQFDLLAFCETPILTGAVSGRRAFAKLVERIVESANPDVLYLDFAGIDVATASFLRSVTFDLKDLLRSHHSTQYAVVANANSSVEEELVELAKFKNDAIILCTAQRGRTAKDFRLIGQLEPKQQLTFELVNRLHEADVSQVIEAAPREERIGKTAWNNRLSALESRGVIMELKRGRAKVYRSICRGGT